MPVAHPEQCCHGKIRSGRLAPDNQFFGAKFRTAVFHKPERSRLAIICAGGIRVFGSLSIIHTDYRDITPRTCVDQKLIIIIGTVQHEAAAMNMKINSCHIFRFVDAKANI